MIVRKLHHHEAIKKVGKWLLISAGSIITILLILLLIIRINSSGIEEPFYDENGDVLAGSIAMNEKKIINGAAQRIIIRGQDINNPVLLRVHGGPGGFSTPVWDKFINVDLTDKFTVCYWEQRGGGYAYEGKIPDSTITLDQIVDDGLTVVNYLREKFNKDKIYIEGQSWGTNVAPLIVKKQPDWFHAYIGVSQMADQTLSEQRLYDVVMEGALKANDTSSINMLKQIGRPPYINKTNAFLLKASETTRDLIKKYVPQPTDAYEPSMVDFSRKFLLNNGMSFSDKLKLVTMDPKLFHSSEILDDDCWNVNLMRDIPEWTIPVYIMQGEYDYTTNCALAKAYFDSIQAPFKKFYLFENGNHTITSQYPEKYRSIYVNEILSN